MLYTCFSMNLSLDLLASISHSFGCIFAFYFIPVFLKVKIMYASLLLNKLIEHQSMDVTVA